ncbi:MAG: kelch repeat-containing protein, partial [Arenibacter algicola]|nr:kelch repeat-containing protein [Arenibacter algicola]
MRILKQLFIIIIVLLGTFPAFAQDSLKLSIQDYPNLPAEPDQPKAFGLAGMLGGVHNGVVIAAGGANFPDALPWEGGQKKWSSSIYILEDDIWQLAKTSLPYPLAYGASVNLPNGILCIGGNNNEETSNAVFLMSYDKNTSDISIINYPDLPEPLSNSAAVINGDYVYVIGGINNGKSTNAFLRLDLKTKTSWERLPDFPGPPRGLHTAVVQEATEAKKIFVVGGRNEVKGKPSEVIRTYLSYNLKNNTWQEEGEVLIDQKPRVLMGASAEAMGSMHLMIYGGSDEIL